MLLIKFIELIAIFTIDLNLFKNWHFEGTCIFCKYDVANLAILIGEHEVY
jgi:hypothetical protein